MRQAIGSTRYRAALACAVALIGMTGARADTPADWVRAASSHLREVWDQGQPDLYVDGYTWHDPHTYTAAKRAVLNSEAWGLGWGRHRIDADDDEEMLYGMVFSDSHADPEPIVGYARLWRWRPFHGRFVLGAGYTAGITARTDTLHNLPFPVVLPLAEIGWGALSLCGTFVPRFNGSPNHGNVGFLFLRYGF